MYLRVEARALSLALAVVFIGLLTSTAPAVGESADGSGRGPAKDMVLWLHWDPTSPTVNGKATQLTLNTSQYWSQTNYTVDGDKNLLMDFYLVPVLASDLTVNGTVRVGFWGNYSGSNNNFQIQIVFYERNSTGAENWTSTTFSAEYKPASAPQYYSFDISNFRHTFSSGSTIRMNLQVLGGAGIYKAVYIDTVTNNSRVVLPCEDYLEVGAVNTFDSDGNPQSGFQSNAANTTVVIRAAVTDPFGGYDIRWSSCTLVGPEGAVVLDNSTMERVAGTQVSFSSTFETSWNYSGAEPGRYNITVWAVDNNGYYYYHYFMNFNYGPYAVSNTSFFFIDTPRFVNVLVYDSMGAPLDGAEVQATVLDRVIDRNTTNLNGLTNLSMPPGPYVFRVVWRDVRVAEEPVEVIKNRTESDPVVVRCRVYYPTFKVLDSHGEPLSDAAVYMRYPNGTTTMPPLKTDGSGEVSLQQTPGGPHELSVVWGGLEVNRTLVLVAGNETYSVFTKVYYMTVRLSDPHGAPILNAQIVVNHSASGIVADSKLSDLGGLAVFRLPAHIYDLRVIWSEALVNETRSLVLNGDIEVDVECRIFYLTVQAVDSIGAPIESALGSVSTYSSSKVMDAKLTGGDGSIVVRVPAGLYNITIHWQDIMVYSASGVEVSGDATHVARCRVHYLTIVAVDSRGAPLESADIKVSSVRTGRLLEARRTDGAGRITSRLPATEIELEARWHDVLVNHTPSLALETDGELVMLCSVHYLTISAVDSRGMPVEVAQIRISLAGSGRLLDAQTTDQSGRAVARLPAAQVRIVALWRDVLVNETPAHEFSGEELLELVCAVYYMDILAVDSRNVPLEDAYVRVSQSGGALVESVRSTETGLVTVRLPVGRANVTITWMSVLVASVTEHEVNASHLLTVRCSVYYLDVTVVDSRGEPVPGVQLSFFRLLSGKRVDTRATNSSGFATFRLPADAYKITAVWQEQLVSPDTDFELISDASLRLECYIYYLTVWAVDSMGQPLENATVVFRQELTGSVLDSGTTGQDGTVVARLPRGLHTIMVTWRDVVVNATSGFELSGDCTLTVSCRVFYLTVASGDVDGAPLEGAEVTISPAGRLEFSLSLTSDASGRVVFRLPAQAYDIRVAWRGVQVCARDGYALEGDALLPVQCRVFYLTVRVLDRDGRALGGVQLTVFTTRGGLALDVAGSALINDSGRAVFRLPVGQYRLVGHLRTTYMMTPVDLTEARAVDLQDSRRERLVFDDYPLPIHSTNAFLTGLLFALIILALLAAVVYVHRRLSRKPLRELPIVGGAEGGWLEKGERGAFPKWDRTAEEGAEEGGEGKEMKEEGEKGGQGKSERGGEAGERGKDGEGEGAGEVSEGPGKSGGPAEVAGEAEGSRPSAGAPKAFEGAGSKGEEKGTGEAARETRRAGGAGSGTDDAQERGAGSKPETGAGGERAKESPAESEGGVDELIKSLGELK
ncbi:MAG: hypothetical protein ACUVV6_06965 [Thermoplasmatota archaeon]